MGLRMGSYSLVYDASMYSMPSINDLLIDYCVMQASSSVMMLST
jgi:hypothetical protein